MTQRFIDKDPADIVFVTFDFSANATAVTAPVVTISLASGTDPSAAAMLLGAPAVVGAVVTQRIGGGLHGCDYVLQCQADDADERFTIEAILPVRDRPVLVTATPVYLTEAEFERRFGNGELRDLLADGNSYVQAENDAASLIDGFLGARYTLPLTDVPALVKGWAADITRWKLWDERAPEEVQKRYDAAVDQLKMLAAGKMALPPSAAGLQAAVGVAFGGYSAERAFTAETLADF